MKDRENSDAGRREAIHDAIVAVEDLAKIVPVELGDDAPRKREPLKPVHGGKELIDEEYGVIMRVARDELIDLAQIVARLDGPLNGRLWRVDHVRAIGLLELSGRTGV
jgi:hypothetical protein